MSSILSLVCLPCLKTLSFYSLRFVLVSGMVYSQFSTWRCEFFIWYKFDGVLKKEKGDRRKSICYNFFNVGWLMVYEWLRGGVKCLVLMSKLTCSLLKVIERRLFCCEWYLIKIVQMSPTCDSRKYWKYWVEVENYISRICII